MSKEITARGRIMALANNCNLEHITELNNREMFDSYITQLFNSNMWSVFSIHNTAGTQLTRSFTAVANGGVLKPVGDDTQNWPANTRREAGITFVQVRASIDLTHITGTQSSQYTIKLMSGTKSMQVGGSLVDVTTFLGNDDLRTYTAETFRDLSKAPNSASPLPLSTHQ